MRAWAGRQTIGSNGNGWQQKFVPQLTPLRHHDEDDAWLEKMPSRCTAVNPKRGTGVMPQRALHRSPRTGCATSKSGNRQTHLAPESEGRMDHQRDSVPPDSERRTLERCERPPDRTRRTIMRAGNIALREATSAPVLRVVKVPLRRRWGRQLARLPMVACGYRGFARNACTSPLMVPQPTISPPSSIDDAN